MPAVKRGPVIISLLTCVYLLAYVFLLRNYGILYDIGKLSFLFPLQFLPIAECIKLLISHNFNDTSEPKASRIRKKHNLNQKVTDCFRSLFVMCATIIAFYIMAVLLGAPLVTEQEETFMFSLLIALLTVFPVFLHLGWENATVLLMNLTTQHEDAMTQQLQQNLFLTVFGAWLGAIVIPLDWDRPWQAWPIPCSLGALTGYFFSHFVTVNKRFFKSLNVLSIFQKKAGKYGI